LSHWPQGNAFLIPGKRKFYRFSFPKQATITVSLLFQTLNQARLSQPQLAKFFRPAMPFGNKKIF